MEGLEDGQIPAPLPLLRRSHANAPVVYKSAFGEPLQPVIHRDSAATERFWNAVVVHTSQCLPLGTPVCPECVRNTQSSEVTAASSPSRAPTSTVRRGAKLALIPTLAPPAPGAISGGEHVFDQELSYELHKLWEMFENSPCEECGEVVAVPNLDDDSWDNSAKGCLTWTGSSRFTVYVHDYGKAEVNIGTVPSTELYISTCAAVRVPAQYLLPVVSLPYPLTPGTITQWRSLSGPAASSAPLSTDFFRPRAAILAAQAARA